LKAFRTAKYLKVSFFEINRKLRILRENLCRELTECSYFVRAYVLVLFVHLVTVGTFRRNIHCIVFVMVCFVGNFIPDSNIPPKPLTQQFGKETQNIQKYCMVDASKYFT
jgi:hypothetical protein